MIKLNRMFLEICEGFLDNNLYQIAPVNSGMENIMNMHKNWDVEILFPDWAKSLFYLSQLSVAMYWPRGSQVTPCT